MQSGRDDGTLRSAILPLISRLFQGERHDRRWGRSPVPATDTPRL